MALENKRYEKFYKTDGTGGDKAKSADLTRAEALWDLDRAEGCEWYLSHPEYGPLIFQLQQMQDEITALREEISANKDKAGTETTLATTSGKAVLMTVNLSRGAYSLTFTMTHGSVTKTGTVTLR